MQRIEVSAPKGKGEAVARMAMEHGASQASVYQVFAHGPDQEKDVVTFQVSTPQSKDFVDHLLLSDLYDPQQYSLLTQPVPGVVQSDGQVELAHPMPMPVTEVLNDFLMRVRIRPTLLARAVGSSAVLSYGLIQNNTVLIIGGLMFSPFVSQVLALAFGLQTRQRQPLVRSAAALLMVIALTFLTGIVVALLTNSPIQYNQFSPVITNLLLMLVIGVVGALVTSDSNGRLQLTALAVASQFATYPAYLGLVTVLGAPEGVDPSRLALIFGVNLLAFTLTAVITYALLKYRPAVLDKLSWK